MGAYKYKAVTSNHADYQVAEQKQYRVVLFSYVEQSSKDELRTFLYNIWEVSRVRATASTSWQTQRIVKWKPSQELIEACLVVPKNIDFEVEVQVHVETLPAICGVLTEGVN